jgi:hypothetical protein
MEYFYKCSVHGIDNPKYKNDVYHPCIRFIESGFAGHQWWMVQTPFYNSDDSIENPLLFYSDSIVYEGRLVPEKWILYDVVKDTHDSGGYNSDPYLYIEDNLLYVLWREYKTERVVKKGFCSALFSVAYDSALHKGFETFVLGSESDEHLMDLSPILIKKGHEYNLLTISYSIDRRPYRKVRKLLNLLFPGFFPCKDQTNGVLSYASQNLFSPFVYKDLIPFSDLGESKPWHFDIISYGENDFLLIYDLNDSKRLYLAYLDKTEILIKKEPILLNLPQHSGLYKSTGVVFDDELLLFHTACTSKSDPLKHELWISVLNLSNLIE